MCPRAVTRAQAKPTHRLHHAWPMWQQDHSSPPTSCYPRATFLRDILILWAVNLTCGDKFTRDGRLGAMGLKPINAGSGVLIPVSAVTQIATQTIHHRRRDRHFESRLKRRVLEQAIPTKAKRPGCVFSAFRWWPTAETAPKSVKQRPPVTRSSDIRVLAVVSVLICSHD